MDPRDRAAGLEPGFFWFAAKLGLLEVLLQRAGIGLRARILSLGTGTGEEIGVLDRYGAVTSCDIDWKALRGGCVAGPVAPILARADRLPVQQAAFDVLVALDLLEHIENDTAAAAEMMRVLRPGGILIATVPAFNWLFSAHDRLLGHYRRYTLGELRAMFATFEHITSGYWCCLPFPALAAQRLLTRFRRNPAHVRPLPRPLNTVLYRLLCLENGLLSRGARLPFGSTAFCVCRKR